MMPRNFLRLIFFFTIMIDGLYGQQCSIKKSRLVLSRKHGPALASRAVERLCVGLKMRAKNDFTGVILEKDMIHPRALYQHC